MIQPNLSINATPANMNIALKIMAPNIPPEQHIVLISQIDFECGQNNDENKKVIDAQRLLYQICRKKLDRTFFSKNKLSHKAFFTFTLSPFFVKDEHV